MPYGTYTAYNYKQCEDEFHHKEKCPVCGSGDPKVRGFKTYQFTKSRFGPAPCPHPFHDKEKGAGTPLPETGKDADNVVPSCPDCGHRPHGDRVNCGVLVSGEELRAKLRTMGHVLEDGVGRSKEKATSAANADLLEGFRNWQLIRNAPLYEALLEAAQDARYAKLRAAIAAIEEARK